MSSFPILDLVVGMIFIYFLLSIICSSAVEMLMTGLKARARILEEWLCKIFDSEVTMPGGKKTLLGQAIMDHCAVTALSKKGIPPSYIDAKNFTAALIERVTYDPDNPKSVATNINDIITSIKDTEVLSDELKRAFLSYAYDTRDTYSAVSARAISEVEYFKLKVENWYDSSMDRLTGTLKKRYSRPMTFLFAIVTALFLNADSVAIAKYLYTNPEVRRQLVADAYRTAKDSTLIKRLNQVKAANQDSASKATLEQLKNDIQKGITNINEAKVAAEGTIPLGWTSANPIPKTIPGLITKITGLAATILAIIMGAPFWFDILNKIANLRSTGPKPPSSVENTRQR